MKTGLLFFPGALDAFSDRGGIFFGSGARDVAVFDGGNFDVEIDAVEERAGDALAVTLHLDGAAAAFAFQIAEVSARIWIPIWALQLRNLGAPPAPQRVADSRFPYSPRSI
jgi:hypothetical protein